MARTTKTQKKVVFAQSYIRSIIKTVRKAQSTAAALRAACAKAAAKYGKSKSVRLAINAQVLKAFPKARRRSISATLALAWTDVLGTSSNKNKGKRPKTTIAQRLARNYTRRQLERALEIRIEMDAE